MIEVRYLHAAQVREHKTALADVLVDCVQGGASVSFMAPFSRSDGEKFFDSLITDVEHGSRIVLAAFLDENLVGTVQLITAMPPNQPHRAEVAKLLVARSARCLGIGTRLMEGVESAAKLAGKTLLVLDTASGSAERLYIRSGWSKVGIIPGYAMNPDGTWCDTTIFWKKLRS